MKGIIVKLVPLNKIFNVEYGNQIDLNKLTVDPEGINFVSRTSQWLGVVEKVAKVRGAKLYDRGLMTVTLGGTYLLSSFVQPEEFYTAQNIKVLTPKTKMTFGEKHFYMLCISKNRFKYSSHGREANKSLDTLLVPDFDELPEWVNSKQDEKLSIDSSPLVNKLVDIDKSKYSWFRYSELFEIERGRGGRKTDISDVGKTLLVTSTDKNNGVIGYINSEPEHKSNVLTVNRNGSVGEVFFQAKPFCSTEDVHVFNPKFDINVYRAMYLIPLIKKEKYRYSYGRKWGLSRMRNSKIKLPAGNDGRPNWELIEEYIKSLKFSKQLTKPQI